MRNPLVKTLFFVFLILFCAPAWSLGLGDARAESFIGQPLSLRIELLTSPGDDLDSITARLGSADDFALVGASRGAITVPLTFTIQESPEGASILVQSRVAVHDPVLRLVVEVTWSSGRMLREYTVFLDPPTVPAQPPRAPTTQAPAPPQQPARPAALDEQLAESESDATESSSTPAAPPAEADAVAMQGDSPEASRRNGSYGPIRSGETLWRIASDWVGDTGMDMSQVMLAIQRKNPDAFMRDNINLLKRGAQLDMPSDEEVNELTQARARELVAQQEAAFRMRGSMAAASTPLIAADTGETLGRSAASTASAPEPLQEEIARLEIVPPSEEDLAGRPGTGAASGGEGSDEVASGLREELARTEEELFSERQQNTYLRERIAELEAQLELDDGEPPPGVSDSELAQFQERLQNERLAEAGSDDETGEQAESQEPAAEVPQVVTTTSDEEIAWYNSGIARLIMIVIVVATVGGWLYSRRRSYEDYDTDLDQLGELPEDATEDSRDVDVAAGGESTSGFGAGTESDEASPEQPARVEDDDWGITFEDVEEAPKAEEPQSEDDVEVVSFESARRQRVDTDAEATLLDESSSDPEIKLDLARAYISMGDKEAARVILSEVLSMGTEAQQGEARSMLDEL